MRSSRLVAESLTVMPVPVAHALPAPQWLDVVELARVWQAASAPSHCTEHAPEWLHPRQEHSWRRAVAAIEGWRGAVLAEPVGSGKSWVALAVAQHFTSRPVVIGPASLAAQWQHVAIRAGVSIHWHSHERLSRGSLPACRANFVIVDEAHRFRHLHTQRASSLAPWLVDRCALLLTATPIINRRADLIALLQLIMADDALALDGVASLRGLEDHRHPPVALSRVVIRTMSSQGDVPARESSLRTDTAEHGRCANAVASVAGLRLSADPAVRRLLTTVLLDAAASSDAAWRAALRRYRALLLQSRDAGGLSRSALRHFAGPALDQLVLWPLLTVSDHGDAPPLEDLQQLEALLAVTDNQDRWMEQVAAITADGRPTICFTRHRATAIALVRHLGDRTAWVTGNASGIGPLRLAREQVLGAFGPRRDEWQLLVRRPACLVCTEVLSEGLDLQGAARVVHLDLPWHPARLAQRNGRVQRIGQLAPHVEVVVRRPPSSIERVLGIRRAIRHKARLGERWIGALISHGARMEPVAPGVWCTVGISATQVEAVALVVLRAGARRGTIPLQLCEGLWQVAPDHQLPPLAVGDPPHFTRFERNTCARLARRAVWRALELARTPGASRPRLVSRLLVMAHDARRRRDASNLDRLDRLLATASSHAPFGVEQRLAVLADASDEALLAAELPAPAQVPRPHPVTVLLVLFRHAESPLR
jgi:hypothetical protein